MFDGQDDSIQEYMRTSELIGMDLLGYTSPKRNSNPTYPTNPITTG